MLSGFCWTLRILQHGKHAVERPVRRGRKGVPQRRPEVVHRNINASHRALLIFEKPHLYLGRDVVNALWSTIYCECLR